MVFENEWDVNIGVIYDDDGSSDLLTRLKVKQVPQIFYLARMKAYNTTISTSDEALEIINDKELLKQYRYRTVKESMSYWKIAKVTFEMFVWKAVSKHMFGWLGFIVASVFLIVIIFAKHISEKIDLKQKSD